MDSYINASINEENRAKLGDKFPLLGTSGMKGIGKTTMLEHGLQRIVPQIANAKGAYLTFNGGPGALANVFADSQLKDSTRHPIHSFGHALMALLEAEAKHYLQLEFACCLRLFRKALNLNDDESSLVLFVDEIGHLEQSQKLVSALMSEMDGRHGKLVFVFAHISQQFLNISATDSGRKVIRLPLQALPIDVWKTDSRLQKWSSHAGDPAVHQLLLQCCGHPRSLFDGLPHALESNRTLLNNPHEKALITARMHILDECKFNSVTDDYLLEVIPKWFSILPITDDLESNLEKDGLLLPVQGDGSSTKFLLPLLLQDWAQRKALAFTIAHHLDNVYAHDAVLGDGTEKKMEALMYHYEAVLRKAVEGKTFRMSDFYASKHVRGDLCNLIVSADLPNSKDLVAVVEDFSAEGQVLQLLQCGFIVVSQRRDEIGVEYLSPFRGTGKELLVACVQCKFVQKRAEWKDIKSKMEAATTWLDKRGIRHFPVIYTTIDQKTMKMETHRDGIYFTERDMFEFTKKLGVLRLHTQKLGKNMEKTHSWICRASNDADM
jgi:hypothetical protein